MTLSIHELIDGISTPELKGEIAQAAWLAGDTSDTIRIVLEMYKPEFIKMQDLDAAVASRDAARITEKCFPYIDNEIEHCFGGCLQKIREWDDSTINNYIRSKMNKLDLDKKEKLINIIGTPEEISAIQEEILEDTIVSGSFFDTALAYKDCGQHSNAIDYFLIAASEDPSSSAFWNAWDIVNKYIPEKKDIIASFIYGAGIIPGWENLFYETGTHLNIDKDAMKKTVEKYCEELFYKTTTTTSGRFFWKSSVSVRSRNIEASKDPRKYIELASVIRDLGLVPVWGDTIIESVGESHMHMTGEYKEQLSELYRNLGRMSEAESAYRESLDARLDHGGTIDISKIADLWGQDMADAYAFKQFEYKKDIEGARNYAKERNLLEKLGVYTQVLNLLKIDGAIKNTD